MKGTQFVLLLIAAACFTAGGFALGHLDDVMGMIILPFGVGIVFIFIALSPSEVLRELNPKRGYEILGCELVGARYLARVRDLDSREVLIADLSDRVPKGFMRESLFKREYLVPRGQGLKIEVGTGHAFVVSR